MAVAIVTCLLCFRSLIQAVAAQAELIGHEQDKAGDEKLRARLHQEWLQQQDAHQVEQLMNGVRNGFRRKRPGDLLDENVRSGVC